MTVKSIKLYKSEEYKNSKGKIQKYVSIKNSFFSGFGEVYFNSINKNSHTGWNLHKKNICLIKCISGKVLFHFIDLKGKERKITLNSTKNEILKIPSNIWFSFKSLGKISLLVNLINRPHKDSELKKQNLVKNHYIKN